MDWLFNPIADFFRWLFVIIEAIGPFFNLAMIVITVVLTVYWVVQMFKHGSNDKGFFKKS